MVNVYSYQIDVFDSLCNVFPLFFSELSSWNQIIRKKAWGVISLSIDKKNIWHHVKCAFSLIGKIWLEYKHKLLVIVVIMQFLLWFDLRHNYF